MTNQKSNSKIGAVIGVASGNFLEMYDFMVYAYYASYIAREIFPSNSAYASLMLTLGTFGAGYLMRPLGAVVLGAYIDRHGRRSGLTFAPEGGWWYSRSRAQRALCFPSSIASGSTESSRFSAVLPEPASRCDRSCGARRLEAPLPTPIPICLAR